MGPRSITYGLVLVVLLSIATGLTAQPQRVGPVEVELIAQQASIQPGQPFRVGLYIVPDHHWHVYWQNPGDAGLPPTLDWSLPNGFSASPIKFPAPIRILSGPLAAYGYEGAGLYPVTITPPSDLRAGDSVTLTANADWLVCKEECLPGSAALSLILPVTSERTMAEDEVQTLFAAADTRTPQPLPDSWTVRASLDPGTITLTLQTDDPLDSATAFEFFASEKAVIEHAAEQIQTRLDQWTYELELRRSAYSQSDPSALTGVLAVASDSQSDHYMVEVPITAPNAVAAASTGSEFSPWLAILFAFLGGLILNLMPCVLPVLSLKVLGLVEQAQQGRRAAFTHGAMFTFGVMVSFWVIVAVMLLLQAGGEQLGWGFQLQSPTFVMILAGFMFLFALSLFGVFEIGLPGASSGMSTTKSSGLGGAFVSGVIATLVATPCTAPFMGAALGFSLTQPAVTTFAIYTSLALGMAAPYLVLSVFPALLKFVPKPGRWMETLKQAMGFLLAATVIWLGWVLASQAGAMAVMLMLIVLLLIAMAAWIYGRWGSIASAPIARWISRAVAFVIAAATLVGGSIGLSSVAVAPSADAANYGDGIVWQEYSRDRVDALRSDGHPVFIDFTAAWCLSCQVNEKVAFSSDNVQQRFAQLGIVPLKADWTNRSEEITRGLASYGRNSVPLYVLYTPGETEPTLLPEILTPGIVLDALNKVDSELADIDSTYKERTLP